MGLLRRVQRWCRAIRGGHRVYLPGDGWVGVRCLQPGSDGEPRKVSIRGWGAEFISCPVCGRLVGLPKVKYKWVRETGARP